MTGLSPARSWTRAELAERLDGDLVGPDGPVSAIRDPEDAAGPDDAVAARQPGYLAACLESRAGLLVVASGTAASVEPPRSLLLVSDPEAAWGSLLEAFYPALDLAPGVHENASVHPRAELAEGVHVGAGATVARGARVGARSRIMAGAYVGEGAIVGRDCLLHPGARLLHGVVAGDRVTLQAGAVVGADGFGYRRAGEGSYARLQHIGMVVLEDDVEIGANSVVDRGTVGASRIGAGTKIGNCCIVAHNSDVGRNVLMIGAVQMAGSVSVGDGAILMGQVGVVGHITIGAGATITAQSGVSKDVPAGETHRGSPAQPIREALRMEARLRDVARNAERLAQIEASLARLDALEQELGRLRERF